jgi:hypothetical protein
VPTASRGRLAGDAPGARPSHVQPGSIV